MSTERLKNRLARLRRRKPTRSEFEAACDRHDARLNLLIEDRRGEAMRFFDPDPKDDQDGLMEAFREALTNDNRLRWLKDQSSIERFLGSRREARKARAWGRNPDQMLRHLEAWEWVEIKARDPSVQRLLPSKLAMMRAR